MKWKLLWPAYLQIMAGELCIKLNVDFIVLKMILARFQSLCQVGYAHSNWKTTECKSFQDLLNHYEAESNFPGPTHYTRNKKNGDIIIIYLKKSSKHSLQWKSDVHHFQASEEHNLLLVKVLCQLEDNGSHYKFLLDCLTTPTLWSVFDTFQLSSVETNERCKQDFPKNNTIIIVSVEK